MSLYTTEPSLEKLPAEVPVFPVSGAILLPSATLPLHVFEPRYLEMTEDALASGRFIAMVQPREDPDNQALYDVGCVGRIIAFSETAPNRMDITLSGICRVRLKREVIQTRKHRRFGASYDEFSEDLSPMPRTLLPDPSSFFRELAAYAQKNGFSLDLDSLKTVSHGQLVNALSMFCPFDPREKQALLEAIDLQTRSTLLFDLIRINLASPLSSDRTQ